MKDFCHFCQISFVNAMCSEFFWIKVKWFLEFYFTAKFWNFKLKMPFRLLGGSKKNGERRRKSSLHCAKHNFTQKAQPFLHIFTKLQRKITCEVAHFIRLWSCRLRRVDVFTFIQRFAYTAALPPCILHCLCYINFRKEINLMAEIIKSN